VGLIAKDDTLETYLNPIDAKERFLAQGFSDEQVEALFRYRSDGTVEVGNAIKTYMSPNKVKLGELTLERTLQTVTDPEPRERRFIYQSFDALGIQDRDVVNNYMKDLQTKMGAIDKVFGTGIVRGEDGSPLSAKSIKTSFAHQIRNTLASHLTYKELNTNALVGMLDRFDVEDETAVSRVQEMLTRRLTIARMNKDIGEGVPGARETAAMMIRMNACSLQETMLDVRGITESEHYICLNNDVIDRGLRAFINGQWTCRISTTGSTIAIFNPANPTEQIKLGAERGKQKTRTSTKAHTRLVADVSRGLLEANNVLGGQSETRTERAMMQIESFFTSLLEKGVRTTLQEVV